MKEFPTDCPFPVRLDHELYDHRRSLEVNARAWPGGHRVASFILIRVQCLELEPPPGALRDPRWNTDFGTFSPPYRAHSLMEYGNRIGVFRLLDFLQPLGWRVAISVNGMIAQQTPSLVRAFVDRGVEVLASGWSASRMISNALDAQTENTWLKQSLDALAQVTGRYPEAYASQDYGYSSRSADLLAQLGIQTTVDWPNDEKPFYFGTHREMVNLPALSELEDSQMVINRKLQTPTWIRQLQTALEAWPEMASPGSIMALPLHAWISGVPHRFSQFREAMLRADPDRFWQASPSEIASQWRADNKP